MPAVCTVCGATKKTNKVKLFHFAVITQKLGHLQEISKRRRHEWLRVLHKTEEDLKEDGFGQYVCSKHFKSGEPAKIQDVTDPDWIPSQNLVPPPNLKRKPLKAKKTRPPVEKSDPPATKYRKSDSNTSVGMEPQPDGVVEPLANGEDDTIKQLRWIIEQKNQLIHCLQVKLRHHEMDESSFIDDDLKTQFYTGFATYKCFAAFASAVESLLPQNNFPGVTKMKIMIMVVTKLRLNLPIAYLSLKFEIPFNDLSEMFTSSVRQLAEHLQVSWPNKRIIPKFLKNVFGEQLAAIVDILELELDFGSGTFQSIKFVIGYSPNGRISFVSKHFSGVSSDGFMMNESGVMKHFKPSDLILSLRGTLNEDRIIPGGIRDRVYLYAIGSNGLVRLQWSDGASSDLRVNLRALMDQLVMIFGFLGHKQPEMWMKDPIRFLGDAVMLCAALRNLILPV